MVEVDEQKLEEEKIMKKKTHIDHEGHKIAVKTLNLNNIRSFVCFYISQKIIH